MTGVLVAGLTVAGAGPARAGSNGTVGDTVTIDHANGSTTVDVAPERIVSLST